MTNKVIWNVRRCKSEGDYMELSIVKVGNGYEVHHYTIEGSEVQYFHSYTMAFTSMLHLLEDLM